MPSNDYTIQDHIHRDQDVYAQAKYDITFSWLNKFCAFSGKKMANIGAGAGGFSLQASNRNFQVISFEPDKKTFEICAQNLSANKNLEIFNLGLMEIQENQNFDVIVMHDVLEHIENDRAAVSKLSLLCHSDTKIVLSVPALQWLFGLHDEELFHFRRYSKGDLRKILSTHFNIHQIRYFGLFLIPVAWWFSKFKRRPYPAPSQKQGVVGKVLEWLLNLEKRIPLPLGISLLVLMTPKNDNKEIK